MREGEGNDGSVAAVPGTALRGAQAGHQGQQIMDGGIVPFHKMTRLSRCTSTSRLWRAVTAAQSKAQMPRANSVPSRIANAHHVAGGEVSFATGDAGGQEAFAVFAQALF